MHNNSSNEPLNDEVDAKIAYHQQMEHIAIQAGDFTKAEHHRTMEEIYMKQKEHQLHNSKKSQSSVEASISDGKNL